MHQKILHWNCKKYIWVFYKSSFFAVLLAALLTSNMSCKKSDITSTTDTTFIENGKGQLLFSVSPSQIKSGLKSTPDINSFMITIQNFQGEYIFNSVVINISKSGDNFTAGLNSIDQGNYKLVNFFSCGSDGNINYAVPLRNSSQATLVSNALPYYFSIKPGRTTIIKPEIIEIAGSDPQSFGIPPAFQLVENFRIMVAVQVYNSSTRTFDLTDATLTVLYKNNSLFSQLLEAKTETVALKAGLGSYEVKISKDKFLNYDYTFTEDSLKTYVNSPLIILLNSN